MIGRCNQHCVGQLTQPRIEGHGQVQTFERRGNQLVEQNGYQPCLGIFQVVVLGQRRGAFQQRAQERRYGDPAAGIGQAGCGIWLNKLDKAPSALRCCVCYGPDRP